jgi:hypothetical protein
VIGGNTIHTPKGDGQMITQSVSKERQLKAFDAVVGLYGSQSIALFANIIDLTLLAPQTMIIISDYLIEKLALLLILLWQLNPPLISRFIF